MKFRRRDKTSELVAALVEHIDQHFADLHAHLDAATETLAEQDEPPGQLTTEQRQGLHQLRAKTGAKYNPPPGAIPADAPPIPVPADSTLSADEAAEIDRRLAEQINQPIDHAVIEPRADALRRAAAATYPQHQKNQRGRQP